MKAWDETEAILYSWLLKQTNSQHETEDIIQEVFLKAMSNSKRFCSLTDGKAWLFKMTKNHFIDRLRKRIALEDIGEHQAAETSLPVMTQLQTCLPRILPKLSDNDRHIIEMCDLNGLTQVEYANAHGLTLPATKARLRRARIELKQRLVKECQVKQDTSGVCCFKRVQ
ncbi:sigma-70 family RNA polymerase sigma factor [Photobacterium sp. DNB23_23_1]